MHMEGFFTLVKIIIFIQSLKNVHTTVHGIGREVFSLRVQHSVC